MKTSYKQITEDVLITHVGNTPFFVGDLFQRKFAHPAPEQGHAVICFYRKGWQQFIPVCFIHYLPYDEVILVGGGMTDGTVFPLMPPETRAAIRQQGGVFYQVLKFGFEYFAEDCEAFFGYAGDKRAYEVDLQAGFVQTPYEHLIVNFHKDLPAERREYLIEKIHAIGPF